MNKIDKELVRKLFIDLENVLERLPPNIHGHHCFYAGMARGLYLADYISEEEYDQITDKIKKLIDDAQSKQVLKKLRERKKQ